MWISGGSSSSPQYPLLFTSSHYGVLLLPGNYHHQRPQAEVEHPVAAEEVQPAKVSDGALLHQHHRVHPHLLHHHLAHFCNCQVQGQTVAYHPLCQKGDRLQSAVPPRPTCLHDTEASSVQRRLTPSTLDINFLKCSPPARG